MKKVTTILVLLFVLSVPVFADDGGIINTGGKSCPQGQVCFTEGDVPLGGKSDNSIYIEIFDFLKSIFE
jgi:hypothetical protein